MLSSLVPGRGVLFTTAAVGACVVATKRVLARVQYVGKDEQLLVKKLTEKVVINGPAVHFPPYTTTLSFKKRRAVALSSTEYALVRDESSGVVRVVVGPQLLFLGPYEEMMEDSPRRVLVLDAHDGVVVEDSRTGEVRLVQGPATFVAAATEEVLRTTVATSLRRDQFMRMQDTLTGRTWIERGEKLVWLQPHWQVTSKGGGSEAAYSLKSHECVRLRDRLSGEVRVVRGPQLVFPEVSEMPLDEPAVVQAIDLKPWEYCVVQNRKTGGVRVERGEALVWLSAEDRVLGRNRESAVRVDKSHAALVVNRKTGLQTLVSEPQLFVPSADEEVVEVRDLIKLADNEAVVLKDHEGRYHFRYGDASKNAAAGDRSFFLPPYWEVVTLTWSRGRRREKRDLKIRVFDTRPQYMSFEFNCRTSDNVEMVLEGTFFWEVVDLPSMLRFTGDAPGDVCSHARSCFIQLVSKVTLQAFMDTFNDIAKKAHSNDDTFYTKRGIKIHSLEVTRYACADESTSRILQEIIQETTNRMNRLSVQESENEVSLAALRGEVEQERARSDVLTIRRKHDVANAENTGVGEARRCVAFLEQLQQLHAAKGADDAAALAGATDMWRALRRNDGLAAVANGTARVVLAPSDAKLSFVESDAPADG